MQNDPLAPVLVDTQPCPQCAVGQANRYTNGQKMWIEAGCCGLKSHGIDMSDHNLRAQCDKQWDEYVASFNAPEPVDTPLEETVEAPEPPLEPTAEPEPKKTRKSAKT